MQPSCQQAVNPVFAPLSEALKHFCKKPVDGHGDRA